jgi:hypothetical protein
MAVLKGHGFSLAVPSQLPLNDFGFSRWGMVSNTRQRQF